MPQLSGLARRGNRIVETRGACSFVILDDRSGKRQMCAWIGRSNPRYLPRTSDLLAHGMLATP